MKEYFSGLTLASSMRAEARGTCRNLSPSKLKIQNPPNPSKRQPVHFLHRDCSTIVQIRDRNDLFVIRLLTYLLIACLSTNVRWHVFAHMNIRVSAICIHSFLSSTISFLIFIAICILYVLCMLAMLYAMIWKQKEIVPTYCTFWSIPSFAWDIYDFHVAMRLIHPS